jgi:hypothetical protein
MEQVAKSEPLERGEHLDRKRPLVFLDTNVILLRSSERRGRAFAETVGSGFHSAAGLLPGVAR